MTEAVIFDMDGVLLDSEPLHFAALNQVLSVEGHSLTPEDNEHILGTTLEDTFRHVGSRFQLRDPIDTYFQRYDETILHVLNQSLEPNPGVVRLLEQLRSRGVRLGLASSSRRSWVEATLKSLGILEYFSAVVSGDEVTRGKPHPDIYLRTAKLLDASPQECTAIEDAPNGILAAKRAGMRVIAVRTVYTAGLDLTEADVVVDSLEDLDISVICVPLETHPMS